MIIRDCSVLTALSPLTYSVCTMCLFTESNSVQSILKFGSDPFLMMTPFFRPQSPPGSVALCHRRSRLQRMPSDTLGRLRCGIMLLKRIKPPTFTGNTRLSRPRSTPTETEPQVTDMYPNPRGHTLSYWIHTVSFCCVCF